MRERRAAWFEERLASQGWRREDRSIDMVHRDGSRCVEVVAGAPGVRELDATVLRVARWVAQRPARHACIVLLGARLSHERLRSEWNAIRNLVRPDLGRRIALVVEGVAPGFEPRFPWLQPIARLIHARPAPTAQPLARRTAMSPTVFQVLKLVIRHWLLKTGPLSRRRLQVESGATYPTVARALRKLEESGELERLPNRRVQLRMFPQKTWQEMLSLSSSLRRPLSYVDATGRKPDPWLLLKRLEATRLPGVALGGVPSARHWDRHFDLNGLPRIDVVVHAPHGSIDAGFVKPLDSALRPAQSPSAEPVLVVHSLPRAEALFDPDRAGRLPYADPVETLLDLHELRLIAQADELIERLSRAPSR
ncbi:MAG: hypothetical protein HYY17_00265 [Planctomycetes bacterium]|nr:hypothetical protein [Planctomycetota bacterium]